MAKPEWGIKRICPSCGLKYYDLNKSPITCPSCKMVFDPDIYLKSRKGKNFSPKVVAENTEVITELDDMEVNDDEEVVSDDDPILEINKDDKNDDGEDNVSIGDNDIDFIEDTDINEDGETSLDIIDNQKD